MQVRLPSLEALRALEVCIRLGSFERAAEELHITPSAVSKRLTVLEDMLGIILLQPLAAVSWHRPSQQRSQRLRIASTPTFARQILVPELPAFTARHPGQEIELVLSLPHAAHDTPEADVEIRFANPTLVEGEVLLHEQAFLMAAPSLLARHTIQNATDLRDLCLLRCPLEPWAPWFAAAGLDWPEPQQGPSMLDMGLILEAAVAGQGVALSRRSLSGAALAGQWRIAAGSGRTAHNAAGPVLRQPGTITCSPGIRTMATPNLARSCSRLMRNKNQPRKNLIPGK